MFTDILRDSIMQAGNTRCRQRDSGHLADVDYVLGPVPMRHFSR
jgi:hypothetical protein